MESVCEVREHWTDYRYFITRYFQTWQEQHDDRFSDKRAAVSGAFFIGGTKASGDVIGANERVRLAVIGLNGRGNKHLAGFGKLKNVEIASVVDPDENVLNRCLGKVQSKANGKNCQGHKDIRTVLEDKNIDAISIATPNHWHSLMTIWGSSWQACIC